MAWKFSPKDFTSTIAEKLKATLVKGIQGVKYVSAIKEDINLSLIHI